MDARIRVARILLGRAPAALPVAELARGIAPPEVRRLLSSLRVQRELIHLADAGSFDYALARLEPEGDE